MIIACWSGPRNLSTACMYAFGARSDFTVCDEPFYAAYLAVTGLQHPMRDAILATGETDADLVARACATPPPKGHCYQKHMSQHMVEGFDRSWFAAASHVFLIRHPVRVLASYAAKREAPTLDDIGFLQQAEIFNQVRDAGLPAFVIDSFDIRAATEPALEALCAALGIAFEPSMLSWPPGGHDSDGVWAAHWYDAVHRSTGFAGPEGALPDLPGSLQPVAQAAMPAYDMLRRHRLRF
ncbi:MAG: HAD family hydrolase [Pseudomonadota bacterium]